jgi:hypothetical protein
MKYSKNSLAGGFQPHQNLNQRTKCTSLNLLPLAIAAGLMLAAGPAQAVNLLQNPGFETDGYKHTIPTDWTRFAPPTAQIFQPNGNYWNEVSGTLNGTVVTAHSGNCFWKEWGACYDGTNNVAGIYQTFSSTSGSTYQASGWLYINSGDELGADCYVWLQVEFFDSSNNLLALYKSANFSINAGLDTWFQFQVTNACDVTQPVSTGDPFFNTYAITGAVSQLVAPAGTASVLYRYCYLQYQSEGGSSYFDDADLEQLTGPIPPVISNLNPQNEIFVAPSNGVSFDVSSPSGHNINTNAIHLVLNGADVSTNLAFSGSSSNWTVLYNKLQSNATYNVSITATDSFNFTVSASTYFQTTWVGVPAYTYLWEAEDWDFSSGMYVDIPALCNACCETNCYFGQVGVQNVDEYSTIVPPAQFYRGASDGIGTKPSGDYSRPNLFAADRIDYCINPFDGDSPIDSGSEWVNYTRDWPAGTNWIIGRFANGASQSGSIQMSLVNPGVSTNVLGIFTMDPYPASSPSYTTFQFVYLKDTNGNNANIVLNGKETLQVTSGGNMLPTFYMLVAAQVDLPVLSGMYPTGTHPFEPTNALSFTVTTLGSTFPANSIKVNLDGIDVSSNLVITGSASAKNVVYPALQLNATHVAIITVTNALGHGISVINQFDTFTQNNFMFEAEDFDYGGGQYISPVNWYPDAYEGLDATTNIDFEHTTVAGELYPYRNGIPQSLVQNYGVEARQEFINFGGQDFQLDWFGIGDWANYTDVYPTGSFFVYVRTAGLNGIPFSMYLSQVVSGAGTTNQVITQIGQWSAVGINQQTYSWVPLTDGGLVAPVVVKLGGVNTLRLSTTTGDCYPNYFMLVQAYGITLSAARSGGNVGISFPTQAGATYRVFYRTNLTSGNWIYLTTALGNGTQTTVSDNPVAGSLRFYKVTSP